MNQRPWIFRAVARAFAGAICVAALTAPALSLVGCGSAQSTSAPRQVLTQEQRDLNVASFDKVWETVKTRHWDPTLGGLDWDGVHRELRPQVESAQTMDEARTIMRQALARLGQSHFGIIDSDAYEHVAPDAHAEHAAASGGAASEPVKPGGEGQTGIDVRILDGAALVAGVEQGSSAEKAGVKPGWIILQSGPTELAAEIQTLTEKLKGHQAQAAMIQRGVDVHLHGAVGDMLSLTFLDGEDHQVQKQIELTMPPGEESTFGNLPPVRVRLTSTRLPGNVGYLRFNYFLDPGRLMPKIESAMQTFYSCDGIIIDLRGNPGGIGVMANGICGFFVEKDGQKLGEMHTRDATMNFVIFPRLEVFHGPLAILVDELSISTSEIMAGGMQDIGRARVFGTRTAGAALPSTIEKLPNGDGFQFVVANYISASGRVLEGDGVAPDEEVPLDRATLLAGNDPVIQAAQKWIKSSSPASKQ